MTQIKDLDIDDFKILIQNIVKETVEQTLDNYLEDPDFNKKIKTEVENRLLESKKRTDAGKKCISIEQVVDKLNIT